MILIKNRLIVLCLKHCQVFRLIIRLQALHQAGIKMQVFKQPKVLHTILKGAYLKLYLIFYLKPYLLFKHLFLPL